MCTCVDTPYMYTCAHTQRGERERERYSGIAKMSCKALFRYTLHIYPTFSAILPRFHLKQTFLLKICYWGWGDILVSEQFCLMSMGTCVHSGMVALRRFGEVDPRSIVTGQPSLLGKVLANRRSCHKIQSECFWGMTPRVDLWPPHVCKHVDMCAHTHVHSC